MEPSPITFGDPHLTAEARGAIAFLLATGRSAFTIQDLRDAGMGRDNAYRVREELKARNLARKASSSAWELINFSGFTYLRNSGSPEVPADIRQHAYKTPDQTQKHAVESVPELPDFRKSGNPELASDNQMPLDGMPEAPPPVAPSPSPPKPRRVRAVAGNEARALYPALFELTKSPLKGRRAMGVYTIARNLWAEFAATPAQLESFWAWFRKCSPAGSAAAKERRPLNPPMPRQVYEAWPQFLPWWQAQQAHTAREAAAAERAAADAQSADAATPASRARAVEIMRSWRNWRETPAPTIPH